MKTPVSLLLFIFLTGICLAQKPMLVIPKGHSGLTSGVFSPDNKQFLSYGEDLNPTIWDIASCKEIGNLNYQKIIKSAFFLKDNKTLITISLDGEIVYWHWSNKKIIYKLPISFEKGSILDFNKEKAILSIAQPYGKITTWNINSRKLISTIFIKLSEGEEIYNITLDWNAENLAVLFWESGRVSIWDIKKLKLIKEIILDSGTPENLVFLKDNSLLISEFNSTYIYDNKNFSKVDSIDLGITDDKIIVINDSIIISGSQITSANGLFLTKSINFWNLHTKELSDIYNSDKIADFSVLDDTKIIFIDEVGTIEVYDFGSKSIINLIENESIGYNKRIVISGDKKIAAILNEDIFGKFGLIMVDSRSNNIISSSFVSALLITDIFISNSLNKLILNEEHSIKVWNKANSSIANIGNTESLLGYNREAIINRYITKAPGRIPQVGNIYVDWENSRILTSVENFIDSISIWDIKNLKITGKLCPDSEKDIIYFRPNLTNKNVIISFEDSNFCITQDYLNSKNCETVTFRKELEAAKFLPDQNNILLTANDSLFLYNIKEKRVTKTYDISTDADPYFILNTACNWLLKDNGQVIDIKNNKQLFLLPDTKPESWKVFSKNDSLIAYESSTGSVNIYNTYTRKIGDAFQIPKGKIMSIAFSPDSKYLGISLNNRTTKVFNLKERKEIFTLILFDESDYLVLLPSGYYMSSPNSTKLLHYLEGIKIISFEQLDVKYNRPDKVLEAIGCADTALINSYRKAYFKRIKKLGIDTASFRGGYSVPESDFENRDDLRYEQKNEKLTLHIKGSDGVQKLDRFNIWVNEIPLHGQKGYNIRNRNLNKLDTTFTIELSVGENRIETSILNVNGTESYRKPLMVNYYSEIEKKENVYFIGIGIDKFADSSHNLQYSSKDIRDLSKKLKEKFGDDIVIDTLFNDNVTVAKVKTLKKKLLQTTVNDKVIVSYSGHGLLSKDYDYYLSTYSVNFNKPEENGLPYDELENLLDSIPARKKLMLIDACHSGEVDKDEQLAMNTMADSMGLSKPKGGLTVNTKNTHQLGLKNSFELMQSLFVNVGKSTGATIISAAAGNQFALEKGDLKNGVFTYCILEAMNTNTTMTVSQLKVTVGKRVEEITKGLQKPTSRNETINSDWKVW